MEDFLNMTLFGEEYSEPSVSSSSGSAKEGHFYRKTHCNHLDLCVTSKCDGSFEMPILKPYLGPIPEFLIPFNQATYCACHYCGVHFYIDDYLFERIWKSPDKYVPFLRRFLCVIGPDFSQYRNMPYPLRLYNCFRNRVLTQYYQEHEVKMVPNVTWSNPDSYEYSFSGIPKNSVIAINCTGIVGCHYSKYLWYKGYEEALKRLEPSRILRYGSKMEGEMASISTYYQNERLKVLRDGR